MAGAALPAPPIDSVTVPHIHRAMHVRQVLSPAMAVAAEIKTGRRRVISNLLSPPRRYAHDGIRGGGEDA